MTFHMFPTLAAGVLLALNITTINAANAQTAPIQPTAQAVYIATENAPQIDGDLSDPVWQRAIPIENFTMVRPTEGAEPSEPVRALILYDDNNLYIGFYLYDSKPEEIRTETLRRDPGIDFNDGVRIILDPFKTGRDSFYFGVNSGGAKLDGLSENNANFVGNWDTIWDAKAKIVKDGWIAEVAIPFRSIAYPAGADEWNINLVRTHRRTNELVRWSNIDRTKGNIDLTQSGTLTGLGHLKAQGRGLDVQTFAAAIASYDWETGKSDGEIRPSGNLYYRFTPALTGTVTLNTDFSDTPLDARQVNTGRFSLFFPETRDFFLQDSAAFSVGNRIFRRSNGRPFFSRRIGIVNGTPVNLDAGIKLSGHAGETNIGALIVRTGDNDLYAAQTLGVLRLSRPLFEGARGGFIYTNGNPSGRTRNNVLGFDLDYQKSNIGKNRGTLTLQATGLQSDDDGARGNLYGGLLSFRNDKWDAQFRYLDIDDQYNPALGFLNRRNIRNYNPSLGRTWRFKDSKIDGVNFGMWYSLLTNRASTTLSQRLGWWSGIEMKSGYRADLGGMFGKELIENPFNLAGRILVPAGIYKTNNIYLGLNTPGNHKLALGFNLSRRDVYDGTSDQMSGRAIWQPNQYFELGSSYQYSKFDLPNGRLGIHIASANLVTNFSATMSLDNQIQYDNISEQFSLFSRFRWEPTPYREIFVSLGHNAIIDPNRIGQNFRSSGTSVSIRLGQTFRL